MQAAITAAETNSARRFLMGYDAVAQDNKRKTVAPLLRSEDDELNATQRRQLQASTRDVRRNYTVARWMVDRHLDYVTTFNFRSASPSPSINDTLENLVREWSEPANFDIAGRHSRQRALRLTEAGRTVDGDLLVVRQTSGHVQLIESDRVRETGDMPDTVDRARVTRGIVTNKAGRAKAYIVARRGSASFGASFKFDRLVPAHNAYLHACYDRVDQVRGISPIASALNELRDAYEIFDHARAKAKVAQMFGLVFFRDGEDTVAPNTPSADPTGYQVDFGRGPVQLDLEPGDDAKFLESQHPGGSFESFTNQLIGIALKSLAIPRSFWDESFTNFSGARQALILYERAADQKRADNRALLDWLTRWRIQLWSLDGRLPKSLDPADLRWEWQHAGLPWIDPLKEVTGHTAALAAALTSRTRILKQQGLDFADIVAELKREKDALELAGLPTSIEKDNALIAAIVSNEDSNSKKAA